MTKIVSFFVFFQKILQKKVRVRAYARKNDCKFSCKGVSWKSNGF